MENITLDGSDFSKLMPLWMRTDDTDASLAESIDTVASDYADRIALLKKWINIDSMDESQLDNLAWEMNVSWYQYDATLTEKRDIIKNARKIHRKLGTKWAIEQVLTIYFNTSTVLEWFEYDGTPGHFKIQTINTATVDEDAEKFLAVLDDIKRYSQVLDEIEVLSVGNLSLDYVIRPRRVDKTSIEIKD